MNLNREWFFVLGVIIIFLTLDLWTKKWAEKNLKISKHLFGGKIQLIYVRNYGIAFNRLSGKKKLIIIINLFLFTYLGYLLYIDIDNYLAYSLILAGGLGNFIGRLQRGYITDFIYFNLKGWPVFNIADFEVLLGIAIVMMKEVLG
ncbi:signal peptidase II [Fusobacteria bacterium ZRK30]|nr:signal peptidase II [Fusobacteria bacterium ZRK30]